MKYIINITLVLIIANFANARINETPEQFKERYGEPTKIIKEEGAMIFKKTGYRIFAVFDSGKAYTIFYQKFDSNGITYDELSDNEIEILMNLNEGDSSWGEVVELRGTKMWTTLDESMSAVYNDKSLAIITKRGMEIRERKTQEEEAEKLQGF
ncbi:MAG: hypothetical protein ACSHYA_02560 [Opitutaceae bacterium]